MFGTGTLSAPAPGQAGSLLELSGSGKQALVLANGATRTFLQDGDTVILRRYCKRDGMRRIGFGDCAGTVAAAKAK
ncbi:MAG: fumarylacetoacetase [Janthinobacterium sp.]|jgi:fumarylacetoacetase